MKRYLIVTVLLALLLAGCAGWDNIDKGLAGIYIAEQVVDTLQTRKIFKDDRFYEKNPVIKKIGPDWLPWYKAATTGVVFWLTDQMSSGARKTTLAIVDIMQGWAIHHNFKIGVRF